MSHTVQTEEGLNAIEKHLSEHAYVSGGDLPNAEDARIFFDLKDTAPNKEKHPNLYFWYQNLRVFSPVVLKSWSAPATGAAPAEKKEDVDLFGDDDDEEEQKKLEELKKKKAAEGEKKKKAVVARSIVIFEVKVFEQEQDLDELAKRIFQLEIDGLVWRTEYEKVPIAFGMNKLRVGCTVEDDKVLTDDIFDKILEWEDEIQSCDIVSFQKV